MSTRGNSHRDRSPCVWRRRPSSSTLAYVESAHTRATHTRAAQWDRGVEHWDYSTGWFLNLFGEKMVVVENVGKIGWRICGVLFFVWCVFRFIKCGYYGWLRSFVFAKREKILSCFKALSYRFTDDISLESFITCS